MCFVKLLSLSALFDEKLEKWKLRHTFLNCFFWVNLSICTCPITFFSHDADKNVGTLKCVRISQYFIWNYFKTIYHPKKRNSYNYLNENVSCYHEKIISYGMLQQLSTLFVIDISSHVLAISFYTFKSLVSGH